jgi:hypothetical protein
MIHETITVYRADSVRAENGSQKDLPIFGRFAAIVRADTYRLTEGEEGWYIGLPYGSTLWSGDGTEEDAREAWERVVANLADGVKNREGWTTDRDVAKREAIANAANRHNMKAAESSNYARKFGGEVTIAVPVP